MYVNTPRNRPPYLSLLRIENWVDGRGCFRNFSRGWQSIGSSLIFMGEQEGWEL